MPLLFCSTLSPDVDVIAVRVSREFAARILPEAMVERLVPPFDIPRIEVPTVFDWDRSILPKARVPDPLLLKIWFAAAVVNEGTPVPFVIKAALLADDMEERVSTDVV